MNGVNKFKTIMAVTAAAVLFAAVFSGCNETKTPAPEDTPAATAAPSVEELAEAERILSAMTLEEKVWQMFFAAPEDIIPADPVVAAGEATKQSIEQYPVGGIIYFGKNIESEQQVTDMIRGVQSFSRVPLFIAVDEEGGRVARLGNADIGVKKLPPMAQIGESGDPSQAYEAGSVLGDELTRLGFNVDFAPVADVLIAEGNEDIGDRSFGSDPQLVADMVSEEIRGMKSRGLYAALKHFPGNGSAAANTHEGEAVSERTLAQMRETEFIPFKAGIAAGAEFVMAAHMSVPDITGDMTPATLSSAVVTDLLRGELGFEGIIISDALNMGAITNKYTPEVAAVMAVNAGVDMLLMSPDIKAAADAVIGEVRSGAVTEERINQSVRRILNLKETLIK